MAKIKLVVFDMDGTLLKPRSCWAYIHEHFGTDNSEMLKLYIEQKITDQEFVKADISLWENKSENKFLIEFLLKVIFFNHFIYRMPTYPGTLTRNGYP